MNLLIYMAFLIIGFILGYYIRKEEYELQVGEEMVNNAIKNHFGKDYFLLTNITLPADTGMTSQIDQVIVSRKGIFVIEAKHYKGLVQGSEAEMEWTQVIKPYRLVFRSRTKRRNFRNPLRQNYGHLKALQQHLPKIFKSAFHSIIVFSGDAKFKNVMPSNVIYIHQLAGYISTFREDILTEDEVVRAIGTIQFKRFGESKETDAFHLENIRRKHGK